MNNKWPQWAVLRAEQVAELPPGQRGPWEYGNSSCRITKEGQHPAEAPYFFHCGRHLVEVRQATKQTTPWPSRDQGLCTGCGQPAEHLPKTMNHRVACVRAESTNSTIARLNTMKYCQQCSAKNGNICRGTTCRSRDPEQRNIVQGPNCCPTTRTGHRRHCTACCSDGKQRQRDRENHTLGTKAGSRSGIARRKKRDHRRREVRKLQRAGINKQQIARQLNVSPVTIERDITAIGAMTQAADHARAERTAQRRETVSRLSEQGLTTQQIAQQMGLTGPTVQKYLAPRETQPRLPETTQE